MPEKFYFPYLQFGGESADLDHIVPSVGDPEINQGVDACHLCNTKLFGICTQLIIGVQTNPLYGLEVTLQKQVSQCKSV